MNKQSGITLINVLVGASLLAILSAIALPNFQLEQVRSKIALSHINEREVGLALEAYKVDQNAYPPDQNISRYGGNYGGVITMYPLTTPVAYIQSIPQDPFNVPSTDPDVGQDEYINLYHDYWYFGPQTTQWWSINAPGVLDVFASFGYSTTALQWIVTGSGPAGYGISFSIPYNPTNGIISGGTIFQLGP